MSGERTVVVLGGGIGGIVAARMLRKRAPRDVHVVLVDRDETYTFAPSLLWLMSGDRELRQISRGRERLARKGIELVYGEAEELDTSERTLRVDGRDIAYERLVIALGAQPAPELMPGLNEGGIDIFTTEGALAAGRALRELDGGKVDRPRRQAPVQVPRRTQRGRLPRRVDLRHRGARAKVALYTPEPYPMPTAGEALGKALVRTLEERGIEFHAQQAVEEVDAGKKELVLQGGERAGYDLLLAIPPHRTREHRAGKWSIERGWIHPRRSRDPRHAGRRRLRDR